MSGPLFFMAPLDPVFFAVFDPTMKVDYGGDDDDDERIFRVLVNNPEGWEDIELIPTSNLHMEH
ncbi:hypothetical protein DSL72_006694 [Monilinia vaccinii-corymbosi]|uniref:Uncharacterized protein n=1 Tax=Monilinia vaccinii-corymbosi TaxID=61207 RepID=A0A8A3PPL6_9HELO|nr:hypothetical protein DSL72_006694 [Monilinia vaccinii-corymbosi]